MNKVVTLLYETFIFDAEHLGKDVLLYGKSLADDLQVQHELVCVNCTLEDNLLSQNNIVRLAKEKYIRGKDVYYDTNEINTVLINEYLDKEAKNIDVLILYHCCPLTERLAKKYKQLNRNGIVILKTDVTEVKDKTKSIVKRIYHRYFNKIFNTRNFDIITTETEQGYKCMLKEGIYGQKVNKKLLLIPNGYDIELEKVNRYKLDEKENLIITVGRIGSVEKNNELLLMALKDVDISDWKVKFIGPVTNEFINYFDKFSVEYPNYKNKIELVGPIFDKTELANLYNRAKVFVLTSNYESCGLVLIEALRFRNFIISTNVGSAQDITKNNSYGVVINCKDSNALAEQLNKVIHSNVLSKVDYNSMDKHSENYSWSKVIIPLTDRVKKIVKKIAKK